MHISVSKMHLIDQGIEILKPWLGPSTNLSSFHIQDKPNLTTVLIYKPKSPYAFNAAIVSQIQFRTSNYHYQPLVITAKH